jgi:hypothetical protein
MYEYYHHDDIPHLAESHKTALQSSERVTTQVYFFHTPIHMYISVFRMTCLHEIYMISYDEILENRIIAIF